LKGTIKDIEGYSHNNFQRDGIFSGTDTTETRNDKGWKDIQSRRSSVKTAYCISKPISAGRTFCFWDQRIIVADCSLSC